MNHEKSCDRCFYYNYDEAFGAYVCEMELDEDEMERFLMGNTARCPYFRFDDEYKTVNRQI